MTLTNTDASVRTLKKKQKYLYAWKVNNDAQVNIGRSILKEQPTFQSSTVVVDRQQGCSCANGATIVYEFNGNSGTNGHNNF